MKTYEIPSSKVIELDLTAIICLSPSDPNAKASTEKLVEDDFDW